MDTVKYILPFIAYRPVGHQSSPGAGSPSGEENNLLLGHNFPKNCMKMKEIRMGEFASRGPFWIRQCRYLPKYDVQSRSNYLNDIDMARESKHLSNELSDVIQLHMRSELNVEAQ